MLTDGNINIIKRRT